MKTPQLLIITNEDINTSILSDIDYEIISDSFVTSVTQTSCNTNDESYEFDYLITSSRNVLNKLNILKDGNDYICNYFLETSLDGVFIIKENRSNLSLDGQLKQIIEYLFY